jgi:hypothetical protein
MYERVGALLGEANCIKSLGDIALERSHNDIAGSAYERSLPLYRRIGDVLGEANCIKGFGDIALARSDRAAARAAYDQALPLYQAVREPYSIGWTSVRLARLVPSPNDRRRHWDTACRAWASIGRNDLIESLRTEFG